MGGWGQKMAIFDDLQYTVMRFNNFSLDKHRHSVPTDRRSFRTGPKKILEDRSIQDLKIAKRTSFFIQELLQWTLVIVNA